MNTQNKQHKVTKSHQGIGTNSGERSASVAVIVTVMGVIIAIMALYGYKEIIQRAGETAERVARNQSQEISEKILMEQVETGVFDEIINNNIEKIALRGVMSGMDLDHPEKD